MVNGSTQEVNGPAIEGNSSALKTNGTTPRISATDVKFNSSASHLTTWQTCDNHTPNGAGPAAPSTPQGHRRPPPLPASLASLSSQPPSVPCSFLYDSRGSQLYEQITGLPEYYPFEAEKKLLDHHLGAITAHIPPNSVLLELGCGSADKTSRLLQALADRCAHLLPAATV